MRRFGRVAILTVMAGAIMGSLGCKGSAEDSQGKASGTDPSGEKPSAEPVKPEPTKPSAEPAKPEPVKPEPAASTAKPGTVRVAIVYDTELLKSEARALTNAEKRLKKRKSLTVSMGDATEEESSAIGSYLKKEIPKSLPDSWAEHETVMVVSVAKPNGKKPKRTSRGLNAVIVLRPPALEAVYTEYIENDADNSFGPDSLAKWIGDFVSSTKE